MNHGQLAKPIVLRGKKHDYDATLTEFLGSLMDYNPTVNFSFHCLEHLISSSMIGGSVLVMLFQILDDLVDHYLAKSGFQCPDEGLVGFLLIHYHNGSRF
ncbi:hypothetical protein F2Q68_00037706 [Brassica cretica]|uniref:Uncharacterized protein n=1 Tax=Brassica cretica TaxID=69181 RepID=A0A8S9H1D4_BRACR|nr:hypothetical protein F2Q68_00037706 [Brassica cretica]